MTGKALLTKVESWYIDKDFYPGVPAQGNGFNSVVQTIWEPVEMYFDDDELEIEELPDMLYYGTGRMSA